MGGRREKPEELVASSRHKTIIGLEKGTSQQVVSIQNLFNNCKS